MLKCVSSVVLVFLFFTGISQGDFRLERVKTIPNDATVNDILVHDNQIYVAASSGLYNIDADDLETRLLSKKNIDAICVGVKNEIWASIENRYLQNMSTGETTLYNSPGIEVRDVEYSKGKVWIGTNQGILTILTRTNELGKITFSKKSGLPSNNVAFIHIDNQKQMWIGTDQGVVFINKKEKWKTYEKKLSMEAMHYNHEGLWLVSNQEMWVIDPFNRWYPAAIDKGLRKGAIRDITADSTGRLYMASEILVRYDPYEETIESYAANTAIVSKVCTSVESDRDNRIWLGTQGGGLFLFGYADQARTVQDLIVAREKKIAEGESKGVPEVEIAIVESDLEEKIKTAIENDEYIATNTDLGSSSSNSTEEVVADSGNEVSDINSTAGVSTIIEESTGDNTRAPRVKAPKKVKTAKIEITASIKSPIKCPGDKATAVVDIAGGAKPYKITWSDGVNGNISRVLDAGSYKVVVTDSIGQISSTIIDITGKQTLALKTVNKRSPSAEGRLDGNVKIAVSGGTLPYAIEWENGEKGDRARRLTGGSHTISVTDANACKLVSQIELKGARIMPDLVISKVAVGQKLEINNIYYEADSTDITIDSYESLDEVFAFLDENQNVKIEIGGHTNSLPPDEYCDRVSTARAKSVADYLYAKGIKEDRITYKGYGKRNPKASNETKEGRNRNQRVEIKIISLQ